MPEPVILDTHSLIFRLNENIIDPDTIVSNLQQIAKERLDDFPKVADALAQHLKGIQSQLQEAKGAYKQEQSTRKTITKIGVVSVVILLLTGISTAGFFANRAARLAEQERIAREMATTQYEEAIKQEAIAKANVDMAIKHQKIADGQLQKLAEELKALDQD